MEHLKCLFYWSHGLYVICYFYNILNDYTTVSSDQVIELDKRHSMSADIEYNSTGTFNYTCIAPLYRCFDNR